MRPKRDDQEKESKPEDVDPQIAKLPADQSLQESQQKRRMKYTDHISHSGEGNDDEGFDEDLPPELHADRN